MKTEINLSNYEAFAVDYLDGNLHGEPLLAFQEFLLKHPEICDEMDSLLQIQGDAIEFSEKIALYKSPIPTSINIDLQNFDLFCIAAIEGDLSQELINKFEDFLSANPSKRDEFELFKRIKLKANSSLNYPDKDQIAQVECFEMSLYDYSLIAALEGDEISDLNFEPSKSDVELFNKTKIKPDTSIVFPNKSAINQTIETKFIWLNGYNKWANIAAVLLAFFMFVSIETLMTTRTFKVDLSDAKSQKIETPFLTSTKSSFQNEKSATGLAIQKIEHADLNKISEELEIEYIKPIALQAISTPSVHTTLSHCAMPAQKKVESSAIALNDKPEEKLLVKNPILYVATEKLRNIFRAEPKQTQLEVNWQNAAMAGLTGLGKMTESDFILSMVGDRPKDEIVTIKQK